MNKISETEIFPTENHPNHVLINEYLSGQGIMVLSCLSWKCLFSIEISYILATYWWASVFPHCYNNHCRLSYASRLLQTSRRAKYWSKTDGNSHQSIERLMLNFLGIWNWLRVAGVSLCWLNATWAKKFSCDYGRDVCGTSTWNSWTDNWSVKRRKSFQLWHHRRLWRVAQRHSLLNHYSKCT